jgi:hypothetical protein
MGIEYLTDGPTVLLVGGMEPSLDILYGCQTFDVNLCHNFDAYLSEIDEFWVFSVVGIIDESVTDTRRQYFRWISKPNTPTKLMTKFHRIVYGISSTN